MSRGARALLLWGPLAALCLTIGGCGSSGGGPEPVSEGDGRAGGEGAEVKPLLRGGERVVFIGDSLSVEAPPNYPELLPAELGGRAPGVSTANLGEPGSTTRDWLPGSALFEQRLGPELGDADLIAVTLGGNDLQEALGGSDGLDSLSRAGSSSEGDAFAAIDAFGRRLARILTAIRERAPGARTAFIGYPDYSAAGAWRERAGTLGTLALGVGLDALDAAAEEAGPDLMVDMSEATAEAGVDSLLADSEHLGPAGHQLYVEELARALTRRVA